MITNYFDAYRKKADIKNLEKLIQDKEEKMKEYDEFLTSSAGSSLLINRLMSRNYVLTEKAKAQDEEEKKKIEDECAVEFLALDDMQKNYAKTFVEEMKKELNKYSLVSNIDKDIDVNKNLDYLTLSAIKEDDKSFAVKFSKFINALFYSHGKYTQPLKLSSYMTAKEVKDLYTSIINGLYLESLNAVLVDYVKDSKENTIKGKEVDINSIPAGI